MHSAMLALIARHLEKKLFKTLHKLYICKIKSKLRPYKVKIFREDKINLLFSYLAFSREGASEKLYLKSVFCKGVALYSFDNLRNTTFHEVYFQTRFLTISYFDLFIEVKENFKYELECIFNDNKILHP